MEIYQFTYLQARFEDNLSKKSEWISRELEKLSARVQELEELGEIASVQQYTYVSIRKIELLGNYIAGPNPIYDFILQEVRMIQNKLKSIEDTIIWINHEEALFKFPQSSYPDVGDMNVSVLDFFSFFSFFFFWTFYQIR